MALRLASFKRTWLAPEILVLLGFFVLLFLFLGGKNGLFVLITMHREKQFLNKELVLLKQKNQILQQNITSLKQDNVQVEKIAREQLGMARQDEVIYKFVPKPEKPSR